MQQIGQQALLNNLQQVGQQAIVNGMQQVGQQALFNNLQQVGQQAILNDLHQGVVDVPNLPVIQQGGQHSIVETLLNVVQPAGQTFSGNQQLIEIPTKILKIKNGECDLCNEPVQVLPNPASVITVIEFLEHDDPSLPLLKKFFQSEKYFLAYESTPFPGYTTYLEFLDAYILRALAIPPVMDDPHLALALTQLKKKIPRDTLVGPLAK